jgi:hypothetical protein
MKQRTARYERPDRAARAFVILLVWRWRESNPRPQTTIQDFSGRSWLLVLLGPYALPSKS